MAMANRIRCNSKKEHKEKPYCIREQEISRYKSLRESLLISNKEYLGKVYTDYVDLYKTNPNLAQKMTVLYGNELKLIDSKLKKNTDCKTPRIYMRQGLNSAAVLNERKLTISIQSNSPKTRNSQTDFYLAKPLIRSVEIEKIGTPLINFKEFQQKLMIEHEKIKRANCKTALLTNININKKAKSTHINHVTSTIKYLLVGTFR